jgi:alpha-beta hydrolase superfamily lysophospholipase
MASTTEPEDASGGGLSPLRELQVIGTQQIAVTPSIEHCELFTMRGLLTILWHGDPDAARVVLLCGGAMGGLLGPAGGLYHELGEHLAGQGIGTMRVSYRRPNDLEMCTHDLAAAADLASRRGGRSFITMGHSFGGAIAIRTALMLGRHCAGIVTFATQSAGCEQVGALADDVPLLLFHGDEDELLPPVVSESVQMMAGHGEVVLLPGRGHLLTDAGPEMRARLDPWIDDAFAAHAAAGA